jgi:plasmid stabilization system protein ParE
MAEVRWTTEAQRWLEDIFEYISSDNPQAAVQTINGLFERTQMLVNFPEMGIAIGPRSAMCESFSMVTTASPI